MSICANPEKVRLCFLHFSMIYDILSKKVGSSMKNKILVIFLVVLLFILIFFFYDIYLKNVNIENTNHITETELSNSSSNIVEDIPAMQEHALKEDTHLKISVIGDIMCHNTQYFDAYVPEMNTYDFSYVFNDIKEYIENADIAIGNLETTFAGSQKGYSNYPRFNTPEQLGTSLKNIGIDVLSTANNHCMDTNFNGLVSTLDYLDQDHISHVGTNSSKEEQNNILIKEVNDIKIAFLSFTYGTNGISIPSDKPYCVNLIDEDLMLNQLSFAKQQNPDLICVNMHWGIEYQTSQNETQENLADFLFENGVDIILGSHPHVLQPMEKRNVVLENGKQKDCFVIYSLGNFMSDQTKTNTQTSIILNLEIVKDAYRGDIKIKNVSYVPIYMYKSASSKKKYRILDIEKEILKYETKTDLSLGANTYSILKSEFERVKKLMGELNRS